MRKTLMPFGQSSKMPEAKSLGGARPYVQSTAQRMVNSLAPMNVARIYSPTAIEHYDDSDPRFRGQSAQVENIYLSPIEAKKQRSGVAQLLNWLSTGKME